MSSEYYVWDTEGEAQSALDFINDSGWFPIIGNNALTGEPEPDKQQTIRWQEEPIQRCIDDKWTVARIPTARLDALGVPEAERQAFLDTFNPSIEVCDDPSAWFDCSSSSSEG